MAPRPSGMLRKMLISLKTCLLALTPTIMLGRSPSLGLSNEKCFNEALLKTSMTLTPKFLNIFMAITIPAGSTHSSLDYMSPALFEQKSFMLGLAA